MVKGKLERKYKLIHNGRELSQGLLSEAGKFDAMQILVQRFDEGQGYHGVHSETMGIEANNRMLVWMIYLNNAKCGTRFYDPRRDVKAKQGRLVMWPPDWTHPHSGITPNKGKKYIVTGWFSYY